MTRSDRCPYVLGGGGSSLLGQLFCLGEVRFAIKDASGRDFDVVCEKESGILLR